MKTPTAQLVAVQPIRSGSSVLFVAPSIRIRNALRTALESYYGSPLATRGLLADAITWSTVETAALVGPVLGGPAVTLSVRPFLEEGVQRVVFLGYCGAFQPSLQLADAVIPIISRSQSLGESRIEASEPLRTQFASALKLATLAQVISVDDPWATTAESLSSWRDEGFSAVEMELASLVQLQRHYSFDLLAALLVSDCFIGSTHQSGLNSPALRQATTQQAQAIVAFIASQQMTDY